MPPWQASRRAAVIPRSSLKHTWRHFSFPTQSTNTAIIKSFEQVWRLFYERPLPYDAVRPDRRRMRDLDMAICQRSQWTTARSSAPQTSSFLVCIGIAAIYCAANALILWWRQPSKEDAENDDDADTPDGTDTDTADAEDPDDTDDDVETDVETTDADASPTTNRQ